MTPLEKWNTRRFMCFENQVVDPDFDDVTLEHLAGSDGLIWTDDADKLPQIDRPLIGAPENVRTH